MLFEVIFCCFCFDFFSMLRFVFSFFFQSVLHNIIIDSYNPCCKCVLVYHLPPGESHTLCRALVRRFSRLSPVSLCIHSGHSMATICLINIHVRYLRLPCAAHSQLLADAISNASPKHGCKRCTLEMRGMFTAHTHTHTVLADFTLFGIYVLGYLTDAKTAQPN